jgi:hypothetical protein
MNPMSMIVSLIPWGLFSVMIERRGAHSAGFAALAAAALALWFAQKDSKNGGYKIIDVAGIVTFGALAVVTFAGGDSVADWVADYGRATASLVLALVMLGSALTVPFTEQYARLSVPREYWGSPTFRATNRRISAVWGLTVAIMSLSHWIAGIADPATKADGGSRPADLILNWVIPVVLVLGAVAYTKRASANAGTKGAQATESEPQLQG